MQLGDLFNLSTRMFRTRPARTWLTILGISVGISAVLFLVALGYGLQNIILQKIVFNQALLSLTVTPANELIIFNNEAVQELKNIPNVSDLAAQSSFSGQAIMGQLHGTAEIRVADAKFFDFAGVSVSEGKLFNEEETDQVLISEAVLKLFGIDNKSSVIGKKITLQVLPTKSANATTSQAAIDIPTEFTVKGIIADPQDSYVYAPIKGIDKYVNIQRYDQARVRVASSNDIESVKGQIIDKGYQVASLSETIDQANKIFRIIQIVLGLFGAVALVVSSIGMFNTMTVTLLERTNEIGIMRAIGATKTSLKSMFIFESLIIGFLGGVVGEAIGIGFAMLFNFGVNTLAARFGGARTDLFYFPGWFLSSVIVLSMIIGVLSGVFPARRAANLEPLEALRYK